MAQRLSQQVGKRISFQTCDFVTYKKMYLCCFKQICSQAFAGRGRQGINWTPTFFFLHRRVVQLQISLLELSVAGRSAFTFTLPGLSHFCLRHQIFFTTFLWKDTWIFVLEQFNERYVSSTLKTLIQQADCLQCKSSLRIVWSVKHATLSFQTTPRAWNSTLSQDFTRKICKEK